MQGGRWKTPLGSPFRKGRLPSCELWLAEASSHSLSCVCLAPFRTSALQLSCKPLLPDPPAKPFSLWAADSVERASPTAREVIGLKTY